MERSAYHRLQTVPTPWGPFRTKPGARGHADPRYALLAEGLEAEGRLLDANPGVGWVAWSAARKGARVVAIEPSRAALRALVQNAEAAGFEARPGLPWEAPEGVFDAAALVLPAERGSRYTMAAVLAAARALRPGGRLWIAGDKRKGFDRYFKEAQAAVGYGRVLARRRGLRLAVLEKERHPRLPELWRGFEETLLGKRLRFRTLPGVFSEGRVDPASRMLLTALPELPPGARVLDLGAGYGALTLPLAADGARVTALEDDLAALRSLAASLEASGLAADFRHSDVDEALPEGETFAIVVTNPPFHVGGSVILDVAKAFVWAAHRHLETGGRFYLVANPFLKYEPLMEGVFGNVRTVRSGRYKVLLSVR